MLFDRKNLSNTQLLQMYRSLIYPRLIEEKMLVLLRQGKISKWFSGIGQEAIAVGATLALQQDEWIMPLHRNLGVFTARNMPLHQLFNQWQGNKNGYSKGRERSFHFGSQEHHICGMISHLGPQLAIADGVALAYKLQQKNKVSLAFTGEGGTSEGDFHEALNIAAVWDLPVIFLIENNGYALSTPVKQQYRCINLADKAKGYGMDAVTIDGNNILSVYETVKGVREHCIKNQKPYLIECTTFRMRGHEEASGTKYVPQELFALWERKDPIKNFEVYLQDQNVIDEEGIGAIRDSIKKNIEEELALADIKAAPISISSSMEIADVYAAHEQSELLLNVDENNVSEKRFIEAIKEGLHQSLKEDENVILMGQDIAAYGGAFKVTEGFVEAFGKERIRNTPICESAVIGAALGLSLEGYKAVVEMQFADFATMAFNQIVNNLAKIHYRWGQSAQVVIRMPTGGGVGAGPFHSQSNEAWFAHVPGLKIVYPSTPRDAKGLLIAAINDPNPVLFFEHKALYRSISGPVPNDMYEVEIGKASIVQTGEDLLIITYGMGVIWAADYASEHPEISIAILDLRTLLPLDYETIEKMVEKTGRVLVLHEDTLTGGVGAEIAAWVNEHCFNMLDAPVMRCASLDTPIPFNKELEANFMARGRLHETIQQLLNF
ncbi:alpha-ketoacid dehydrogenase subunit alpha/beta [Niabella ginsengisoli]|uniref:Dehydrogenase E1 component subunit alpha/beta n=1 Tax=Niabella ginsengisoli TaxID=522298 RepID=A0ABS9SNN1_9BACT|nr:dehydrogenase E1 component subunit alpha/beta [Niabella ginsengisoli]MCH5599764.1 dehydrogenase E1 component subunit alpha/beta [Niabella ginsengisoli]